MKTVCEWGKINNLEKVFVLPHLRNKWDEVKKENSRAKMYYDVTAKREGFKLNGRFGLYEKHLGY